MLLQRIVLKFESTCPKIAFTGTRNSQSASHCANFNLFDQETIYTIIDKLIGNGENQFQGIGVVKKQLRKAL